MTRRLKWALAVLALALTSVAPAMQPEAAETSVPPRLFCEVL